ncbi:translation machinery-associated protein 7 [Penicillium ochrochloron]
MGGASREGGKVKPLKAAKKEKKELDEDDLAYKEKQRADAAAKKALLESTKGKKGPLNTGQQGIKKSGKK